MEYTDLLKPFTLRNFVIKNRLEHPSALPHFSQGTEKYPGEEIMQHYIELAKNGFGIVTIAGVNSFCGFSALPDVMDISHFPDYDIYDPKCQNYIVQLTEAIHSYGAIASMALVPASNGFPLMNENGEMEIICPTPTGKMNTGGSFTILDPKHEMNEDGVPASELISDDIPAWVFEKIAESHGQQALKLKQLGFDMITIHMSYRGTIMGKMLTAVTNKRTDDYGGDITGRAKFPLMVLKAIRDAVGNHFIIEFHISGEEKMKNGNTIEDTVAFLKMAEKYADIVQIRGNDIDSSSPTGLTLEKYPFLCYAEQVKKSGTKLLVSSVGGWQKPSDAQNAIADGKCDIIAVGRGAIADPDFIKKTIAGQEEDIIPCIRCNRCHGRGKKDPFATVCSVNPCFGLERFKDTMTQNFSKKQKQIAIIGGGPGGMRAAILLNDRGHQVTLFEASDRLGGALKHTDYVPFKWPLKNYKNWLISQVEKRAIDVHLNTCVTPDSIKGVFDAIVVSLGTQPVMPPIKGIEGKNVLFATTALENKDLVKGKTVIIGGGEVGIETGMYLAQEGHLVTVLEMTDTLASDATFIHYRSQLEKNWTAEPNLKTETNASATQITENGVYYKDADGNEIFADAETVIIAAGMRPKTDASMQFYGAAKEFYMIGDCQRPGSVQTTTRNVFYTTSTI